MNDLQGAIVLVTGSNGDIGKAIVHLFEERGAKVIRSDLEAPSRSSPGVDFIALDVTNEASWSKAISSIEERHGALDVLVNNAGIAPMTRMEDASLEQWRLCQQVNVEGSFLGLKTAAPLLARSGTRRDGGAAVVNLCSGASDKPTAFSAAYCVSKAAARMLTRVAAVEFSALAYLIRVNSVHPGVVESRMMDDILAKFSQISGGAPIDDLRKAVAAGNPMGRFVDPAEVAEAVVFLSSSAARFIHGDAIHVDGGYAAS
ncbi:SDR family NAD(P)-dependent oxidoreductase [Novosphingobium mathurense]|uniref:NAD(P)-dependent dehydrogenase, short-chain alcohol dehydrogenase family n=1 Tax=Novosphingobium mathurense TaxID=428990 RepID=A0A1U6ILG8_9SPHN|nr:SDR family oxidoreductase [Novosphingobium mathurense]SLK08851.1 NAD(P)-dependent dehydrogenase, short-chain alcohol dehydrogenase family [Novosphingobium mathurense]